MTGDQSAAEPPIAFLLTPFSAKAAGGEDLNLFAQVGNAIRQAAKSAGVELHRADDIFAAGAIIDQVREAIRSADVILAVCTGRNPNVFYELGLADEQGHSPILVAASSDDLPFDLAHLRAQLYNTSSQTVDTLAVRVERAIMETLQAKRRVAVSTADGEAIMSAAVGASSDEPIEVLDGPPGTKLLIYEIPGVTHDDGAAISLRRAGGRATTSWAPPTSSRGPAGGFKSPPPRHRSPPAPVSPPRTGVAVSQLFDRICAKVWK